MEISTRNWRQVEDALLRDDRCVLPIGCTEQHAFLSLSTDSILASRVAAEAAEPLGVPVFPVLPYGFTPSFMAYPGTMTLRLATLLGVMEDLLDSAVRHGFRRVLIVNGHGGNAPVGTWLTEWSARHPGVRVKFWNWWIGPKTWAAVQAVDPVASHASWMENFPWTRVPDGARPLERKSPVAAGRLRQLAPDEVRRELGDGNYGGFYEKPDDVMQRIWATAVAETRETLEAGWEPSVPRT